MNKDEAGVRSILHALNNYELGNSSSIDVDEAVDAAVNRILNSLGLKLGSLIARLPLLDMPDYLRLAVQEGKLSPTNALLINRTPEELHSKLMDEAETHALSKAKLTQLISQLKSDLSSASASTGEQNETRQEKIESLPQAVNDRWNRIKRLAVVKQGANIKLNRKLHKVEQLLQEIELMASEGKGTRKSK